MTDVEEPDLSGWNFLEREEAVRRGTAQGLPFVAARLTVAVLADLIDRVGRGDVPRDAPGEDLRLVALANVGALAVRSANVTLLIVESGYAADAFAPQRRLLELLLRARELYGDTSGSAAKRWLEHKQYTPMGKLLAGSEFKAAYERLSRLAHDDRRALMTLYSPPPWEKAPPEGRSLDLFPTLPPPQSAGLIRNLILHVLEIATCIAEVHGDQIVVPALVDQALRTLSST